MRTTIDIDDALLAQAIAGFMRRQVRRSAGSTTKISRPVAILAWLAIGLGAARAQPYLPPTGYSLQSAQAKDASGKPLRYGATSDDANWHIAQWQVTTDAPAFTRTGDGWTTTNGIDTITVHGTPPRGSVVLRQDGRTAPCSIGGRPAEFDLYIEPNPAPGTYPSAVSPAFRNRGKFPTLDQLDAFDVSGTYTLLFQRADEGGSNCPVRQGNTSFDVILRDAAVQPAQILWFDIHLTMICLPGDDRQTYNGCRRQITDPAPAWFWKGKPSGPAGRQVANWGVDEVLSFYGSPLIQTVGTPRTISIDLLSGLKRAIADAGDYGLDQDLSHWKLSGVTMGNAAWGGVDFASQWQGFVPTWRVRQ